MAKDIQIQLRMTEEKRDELRAAAEATSRTMSGYLDHALNKTLCEEGFSVPSRPAKPAAKPQRPVKPAPKPQPTRAHR